MNNKASEVNPERNIASTFPTCRFLTAFYQVVLTVNRTNSFACIEGGMVKCSGILAQRTTQWPRPESTQIFVSFQDDAGFGIFKGRDSGFCRNKVTRLGIVIL